MSSSDQHFEDMNTEAVTPVGQAKDTAQVRRDRLDRWQYVGDSAADAVVAELASLRRPVRLEEVEAGARLGRPACRAFLKEATQVPSWVDWGDIERGRRLFVRTHVLSSAALLLGGMVESYTNPGIAEVLTHSGRLIESSRRRIIETGQMVFDTHLPHGLRPWASGWRTLLQIRLLHAHIRHHLRARTAPGDPVPIDQEQSAYTMLMFDVGVAQGLAQLGVNWNAEERRLHHHFWRLAGWLLGVDPMLLPPHFEQAAQLRDDIRQRHFHVGDQARALTHALVAGVERQPPFFLPRSTLYGLARRLHGEEISDQLELPRSRLQSGLFSALRAPFGGLGEALRRLNGLERFSHDVGQRYGRWIISRGLEGRPATFQTEIRNKRDR